MGRVEFAGEFEIDANYIWIALSDFSKVEQILFQVSATELLSERDHGVGAERVCTRYDGYTSRERVVEWDETGYSFRIDIVGGNMPFDKASCRVKVTPHAEDDERSFVSGDFEYVMKWGPVGHLLDRWYVRSTLEHVFELYLAGIEYHLKTGKNTPKDFTIEMAKNVD